MKKITRSISAKTLLEHNYSKPVMLLDLKEIESQYDFYTSQLPRTKVFYAVKCNPNEKLLETLANCGSSFEIASINELKRLESIGFDLTKVIFSNPVKIDSHIKQAYEKGVSAFSYDSPEEINKLADFAPGSDVYLRISVSNRGSLVDLSSKFGANPDHAIALLGSAVDHGLNPIGIAFHVGSQAENLSVWDSAVETAVDITKRGIKMGLDLKMINIGGGMPVQYSDASPDPLEVFARLRSAIKKIPKDIEVWSEPGRFIAAPAGVLISSVISRSHRGSNEWMFLDIGRFQAFVEMFESEDIKLPVLTDKNLQETDIAAKNVTITGPTCDSYDTIYTETPVPVGTETGDKVYFTMAGAYTLVYGSAFNDFPVPIIKVIE